MKKEKLLAEIRSYIGILLGSLILACGFVFFINPYNIVPGGVYGASIVLHNLFPSIQVGTFGYMFDIPLLILSVILLGGKLGGKTLLASLITPLMMNTITYLVYPTTEAVETLDPALLLDGRLDMSNQLMLTVVIGAVLIGLGSGIVVKSGATTGGSDIIGLILQKFCHIRFSSAIMMVDGVVVCFGLVVFALSPEVGNDALFLLLYSLIAIFLISRTVSRVINGPKDDKILFVITSGDMDKLRTFILKDLDRSGTYIKSSGMYTGEDKQMLFLVVSYKEVQYVKMQIKEEDPSAFVVVTDAYDTYGEGWKPLPMNGDIIPE